MNTDLVNGVARKADVEVIEGWWSLQCKFVSTENRRKDDAMEGGVMKRAQVLGIGSKILIARPLNYGR